MQWKINENKIILGRLWQHLCQIFKFRDLFPCFMPLTAIRRKYKSTIALFVIY